MRIWETGVVAALALAGCAGFESAREAQREADIAARGEKIVSSAPDLSGVHLRAIVEYAHVNRPSMSKAALELEDARMALREIAADAPLASSTPWNAAHLNASASYSESSRPATTSDMKFKTRRSDPSGTLSLDLLLWDFGRNNSRMRAQGERVVSAEATLWREGYSVFGEVASAWFSLLRNEALEEVSRTNIAQYAEHLAQEEDRFAQGEAQLLDVLRARLDLARAKESAVAASNDVAIAGATLMAALGLDASHGGFRDIVGEHSDSLLKMEPVFPATTATAAELFEFARTNAPAMKIARASLKAASAQVDYAMSDFLPSLSAGISLNWTDPLWYWRWGVDVAQSIFTGGRKSSALDRAVLALKISEAELDVAEQNLSEGIEKAVAERDSAHEALAAAVESVRQAKENLDTVSSQFEVGDASRVDFTDAVASYAAALSDRVRAFWRGQAAEAALFELAGTEPDYIIPEIAIQDKEEKK